MEKRIKEVLRKEKKERKKKLLEKKKAEIDREKTLIAQRKELTEILESEPNKQQLQRFKRFLDSFPTKKSFERLLTEIYALTAEQQKKAEILPITLNERATTKEQEFKREIKTIDMRYDKYLYWITYTEYKHRSLIYALYSKYKQKSPQTTWIKTGEKGKRAVPVKCSLIHRFIKGLGKRKATSVTKLDYERTYRFCKTFAYKYLRRGPSAYREKQTQKKKIEKLHKRLNTETNKDVLQIRDYISKTTGNNILDVDNKEMNKQVSKIWKLANRKYYKHFLQAVKSNKETYRYKIGKKVRDLKTSDTAQEFSFDLERLKLK
jgi:hypothetical protein